MPTARRKPEEETPDAPEVTEVAEAQNEPAHEERAEDLQQETPEQAEAPLETPEDAVAPLETVVEAPLENRADGVRPDGRVDAHAPVWTPRAPNEG